MRWVLKCSGMDKYLEIPILVGRYGAMLDEFIEIGKETVPRWDYQWDILNDEDLIYYFRGVVILEEFYYPDGNGIGSATGTKFIYRTISNRHLDDDYALANWALQYASNPYVPFDTGNRHGAQTAQELFNWRTAYEYRVAKEREDSITRKEEMKRIKAEAHAERLRKKAERDIALGYKKREDDL